MPKAELDALLMHVPAAAAATLVDVEPASRPLEAPLGVAVLQFCGETAAAAHEQEPTRSSARRGGPGVPFGHPRT